MFFMVSFGICLQWWRWAGGQVWDHSWNLRLQRGAGIWHRNRQSESCGQAEVQGPWDKNSSRWVSWIYQISIQLKVKTRYMSKFESQGCSVNKGHGSLQEQVCFFIILIISIWNLAVYVKMMMMMTCYISDFFI